ncbi:MAG: tRNA-intron lyase [Candidatus Hodarchaeales archaeon]
MKENLEDKIKVLYLDNKKKNITISNPLAQEIYDNGYFGRWVSDSSLVLEPEEIMLLLDRKRIQILDSESEKILSSADIVNIFSNNSVDLWSRYLVYKDLRNRGYVVTIGTQVTAPFRIYPRGGKPGDSVSKTVVFPLPEGESIDLDFLDQIVKQAKIDRKKLLLSVIDRLGDVTYYQASQLDLEPNELEYEFRDETEVSSNEG